MEAVDPGRAGTGGAAGAAGGAGAGRAGRKGRRRVVAPPTSGQSHEVESYFTDPFREDAAAGSGGRASTAEQASATRDSAQAPRVAEPGAELTEHEQWIISQRPPHWG